MRRPDVSVIVPLRGDRMYARRARAALERLELRSGDQLIVADNTGDGVAGEELKRVATVIAAAGQRSSYFARNAGAAVATAEWLLFIDADCVPCADLVDRYFREPIGGRCGAVAGGIVGVADQDSLLSRYARDRNFLDQAQGMHGSAGVAAATGNLLIRRATFDQLGGFAEGIRSAGDVDFCWRMHEAGWTLEQRPDARVEHHHREDLASFLAMVARYGSGSRWLNERHPGVAPRWPLSPREIGRSAVDAIRHAAAGRPDQSIFRLVDALGLVAHNVGYRRSNEVIR
ncbi:MAG: mycofactocin glycosyltransferase [Solirubrobacterales bacterium]|nr:mycofactocin glycosyltransferase [Solirubrobacterales bacterium]